ncbi:MAG: YaiI/YqxD family protein [Gammaproteobacteria bacterium]|nr:YaiI/YqxD family protein [Gammaproteobacteria bacterium]
MSNQITAKIWVDADACPTAVREILTRVADRVPILVTMVANQYQSKPPSAYVRCLQVEQGFDVADNEIVKRVAVGDIVVTSDIPLASEVIEKQGVALSPRGELYTPHNIKARLNMRDFMDSMRGSGIQSGGPPPFSHKDRQAFANQLDRLIARLPKQRESAGEH